MGDRALGKWVTVPCNLALFYDPVFEQVEGDVVQLWVANFKQVLITREIRDVKAKPHGVLDVAEVGALFFQFLPVVRSQCFVKIHLFRR